MGQGRGGQLLGCLGSDQPRLQSAWERHAGLCVSAADLTKMVALLHSVDLAHQGMGSIRTLPQAAHMLDGRQQTLYQLQVARDGLGDSHTGQYSTYWPPWQVHQPRARKRAANVG